MVGRRIMGLGAGYTHEPYRGRQGCRDVHGLVPGFSQSSDAGRQARLPVWGLPSFLLLNEIELVEDGADIGPMHFKPPI
jgi:hypothetical protein